MQICVYIPKDKLKMYKAAKKAIHRDGTSVSRVFAAYLKSELKKIEAREIEVGLIEELDI